MTWFSHTTGCMMARTPTQPQPEVLTKAEAARYLRCSESTVQRLTRNGLLTPYRIGQRPRYPRAMLERFIMQEGASHDHAATT
jgi:excisionase family DNA binding protein